MMESLASNPTGDISAAQPEASQLREVAQRRTQTAELRCRRNDNGEAMPAAILFMVVIFTIFVAVHMLVVSLARTAVQNAANYAVAGAQAAPAGSRENEGELAAWLSMKAASNSVSILRPPEVLVEQDRGLVTALVSGVAISPLTRVEVVGLACGPLDTVPMHLLTKPDAWKC